MSVHDHYINDPTPSRTAIEQYRQALAEGREDDDAGLALVHYRGTEEEFAIGAEYCASHDPLDRAVGANILAQLGWDRETFQQESIDILLPMLADPDPEVVCAAAVALAFRGAEQAMPMLLKLTYSSNATIRFGATYAMTGESPEELAALIRLATDTDRDVRDWAVFSLGSQTESDTPEIRETLCTSLQDEDDEIRGEALVGLARRGDSRVVDALLLEFEREWIGILSIEAAELIADTRLLPHLKRFQDSMDLEEDLSYIQHLNAAFEACSSSNHH